MPNPIYLFFAFLGGIVVCLLVQGIFRLHPKTTQERNENLKEELLPHLERDVEVFPVDPPGKVGKLMKVSDDSLELEMDGRIVPWQFVLIHKVKPRYYVSDGKIVHLVDSANGSGSIQD
ncbi:MAG: hypothetical protein NVSMB66_3730 [Candidatus Doudnabacteria bacterium]